MAERVLTEEDILGASLAGREPMRFGFEYTSLETWKHRACFVIFAMPTHCCVPQCNQKGVKSPTGEKVSCF